MVRGEAHRADGHGGLGLSGAAHAFLLTTILIAVLLANTGRAAGDTAFPRLGLIEGPGSGSHFGALLRESVAVDDFNGHILVADSAAGLVYDFSSPSDTHPVVWDGSSTPAGSFGGQAVTVAVDNTTGDVYVANSADSTHLAVDKFDATGKLITTFGDNSPTANGQLTGAATPAGSFSHSPASPLGIAVNQATHNLYVIDSGHEVTDIFDSAGTFLPTKQITAKPLGLYGCGGELTEGITVDNSGNVFIAEPCAAAVYEIDAAGLAFATWTGTGAPNPFAGSLSVAVNNASGAFYVTSSVPESVVDEFTALGEFIAAFTPTPGGNVSAVAVDQASGDLFVSESGEAPESRVIRIFGGSAVALADVVTAAATSIASTSATLNGAVNPDGIEVSDCHFEYVAEAQFEPFAFDPYAHGATAPCVESVGSGTSEIPVHADVSGLTAGVKYHFRLLATNANGTNTGGDEVFETPPPPTISAASASGLTATIVDLNALIDPHGIDTHYHFEYGTSNEYGTSVPKPDGDAGASTTNVAITTHLTGLTANVTYHWRVVASNTSGTRTSPDHTFTYTTAGGGLPDSRAYEMVTPPHKNGALIGDVAFGLGPDMAEDGSRLILSSVQCFGDAQSCIVNRAGVGVSFQFERTAAGWQSTSLAPSAQQFETSVTVMVAADTGGALLSSPTPPHGEDDIYLRTPQGKFVDVGPTSPPELGARGAKASQTADTKASTADFSHFVFGIQAQKPPLWPFDKTNHGNDETLYEYVDTGNEHPLLVGVTGPRGSDDLVSTCGTDLGTGLAGVGNAGNLSSDGRVVFFTATGSKQATIQAGEPVECFGSGANEAAPVDTNTLYARVGESETVRISGHGAPAQCAAECQGSPAGDAEFQGASNDAQRAFFTSTQRLTDTATQDTNPADSAFSSHCAVTTGVNGCNLYENECVPAAHACGEASEHSLVAVSAGDSSGGPRVQGVAAVSADGSHVYFVAKGVLSPDPNTEGQTASAGADNLYVYERDSTHPAGLMRFIATLLAADDNAGTNRLWSDGPDVANVSPDGRSFVFPSRARLTAETGTAGVRQIFRYDASTGALVRVSHGEAGFNDNGNSPTNSLCEALAAECPESATIVRAGAFQSFGGPVRRDPTMSNDGEYVFFQSPVALTSKALSDVRVGTDEGGQPVYAQNIYEWHAGHVSLISDGRDSTVAPTEACGTGSAVCLLGADGSGHNVFFTTTSQLSTQDTDTQVDFYDARICTTADPCVSSPPAAQATCDGEECHGTPAATPLVPSAASATFNGAGNITPPPPVKPKPVKCKRRFVKRHGKCIHIKHKAHHARKKASHAGRPAGRVGARRGGR
jgi:hypothetical protein